jgi:hypothetical protein
VSPLITSALTWYLLQGLVYSGSIQARQQLVGDPCTSLGSMYPTPSLMGSPFTTLAVTQNYQSHLHCEPEEHPFSFITWLDVLSAGTTMEVGGKACGLCVRIVAG